MNENVTIPADHVCIPLEVYDDLVRDADNYFRLKDALFRNASLSYSKRDLTITDCCFRIILRMSDRERYDMLVESLAEEEKKAEEEKNNE